MKRAHEPIRRVSRTAATMIAFAVALSACAPDLGLAPKLVAPERLATARSLSGAPVEWPNQAWWMAYGDPQLDALEAEALSGSPDLTAAAARLRTAQAQVETQTAVGRPSFGADASVQTIQQSLNEGFPAQFIPLLPAGWRTQSRAAFDLNWDLDFFGANRQRIAAATSVAKAAAAEAAASRLQITTAVAAAYAELARLCDDRQAVAEALDIRTRSFDLVNQRLQNGLETAGELAQARQGIPSSRTDLEALDQAIRQQQHAIAALLGAGPDRGLSIARPTTARLHAPGLPADAGVALIGRRPDLVAARLRAEAAAHQIKAARAAFYPNLTLTGAYGLASLGPEHFFQQDSHIGSFGPALTLPIFSRGRLEGGLRAQRAEYDAAVASYDGALAVALRDVADAVSGRASVDRQLGQSRLALAAAQQAFRVAGLRYQGGLSPFVNVLTSQTALIQSRRAVADLEGQALAQDVALVRALGGGYGVDEPRLGTASRSPAATPSR